MVELFRVYKYFLKIKAGQKRMLTSWGPKSMNEILLRGSQEFRESLYSLENAALYGVSFKHLTEALLDREVLKRPLKNISIPYADIFIENLDEALPGQVIEGIYMSEAAPNVLRIRFSAKQRAGVPGTLCGDMTFHIGNITSKVKEGITLGEYMKLVRAEGTNIAVNDMVWDYSMAIFGFFATKAEVGYGKIRIKYKNDSGDKKNNNRPFRVLNLGTKTNKECLERTIPYNLEWKFKYLVKGHWRTIDPQVFGKNREGKYSVLGYTWVSEHTRGDKDKPLSPSVPTIVKLPLTG